MTEVRLDQQLIAWLLDQGIKLDAHGSLFATLLLALLLVSTWLVFKFARYLLESKITRVILATKNHWDDALHQHQFFSRLAHIIPATMIHAAAPLLFSNFDLLLNILLKGSMVYVILVAVAAINAVFNTSEDLYNDSRYAKRVPITGFVQVGKLLVAVVALLLIVSQILDKSPLILLSSLGAITAIIILVFRDTIMGFVAGINIVANRTVNTGDWIEMPKYCADGSVMAVGLTTVKVRNWDNTISTIPTYALMSESLKNWRGMQESGGRRIKRAVNLNIQSVKFCDEAMLNRLREVKLLQPYLDSKQRELDDHNQHFQEQERCVPLNSRRLTNIGTYRAYLEYYLRQHPKINQDLTLIVRQLPPSEKGIPIELYAFCTDKEWAKYEKVQADIFDHALAILPLFDLKAYQRVSDWTSAN